jgi:hypothetical protein
LLVEPGYHARYRATIDPQTGMAICDGNLASWPAGQSSRAIDAATQALASAAAFSAGG